MQTYHWNGEYWYSRNWSIFHRIRNWIIWRGGWEKANGAGWKLFLKTSRGKRLLPPTPVSLFGHSVTIYDWGWQIRVGERWLVYSRGAGARRLYLSDDGTPSGASVWYLGAPLDITKEASQRN